ncbi:MAG: arginine deiminase-related protein [Pirellulales bacterium]
MREQWSALKTHLEAAGATIELQEPIPGLPDLVFTANAALMYRERAILTRFHHVERQGETPHDEAWFAAHGFTPVTLPGDASFEGAGDALFCGDTLFAGYRIRSHARMHQEIGAMLGVRVIPLELTDNYYYHVDTCFCPLDPQTAIYYPPAFDEYARAALAAHIPNLIVVEKDEAREFACNAVVVGRTVVTNTGCPRLHAALAAHGFTPIATPLSEFVKAGGSAKCLTLRLDGEEAAGWRT